MAVLIRKLDERNIDRLMRETFRSATVNVISIIQGVALGILIQNVFSNFFPASPTTPTLIQDWLRWAPYPLVCFVGLIIVTFNYSHYVGTFERPVSIIDVSVPFLLGLFEIAPMFFIRDNQQYFWFLEGCFLIIAGLAWTNTTRYCTSDAFTREVARINYLSSIKRHIAVVIAMATGCYSISYIAGTGRLTAVWEFLFIFVLLVLGGVLATMGQHMIFQVQRDYDFEPRW
jgi:hypothetical protein